MHETNRVIALREWPPRSSSARDKEKQSTKTREVLEKSPWCVPSPLARSGHLIVNKKERVKVTEQEKKEMGHRRFYREQQPRWWC